MKYIPLLAVVLQAAAQVPLAFSKTIGLTLKLENRETNPTITARYVCQKYFPIQIVF